MSSIQTGAARQYCPREPTVFSTVCPDDAQRAPLERFIAQRYQQVHGASIEEFLPILLEAKRGDETQGAVGIRPGQFRPMFLEQYLDTPIEQQVARIAGKPVDRLALVEIGNLAVTRIGFVPQLFVALVALLADAGFQWVVFTATRQVQRLIEYAGFELDFIAQAAPERLAGGIENWGSYYQNAPRVLAGDLSRAAQSIDTMPALGLLLDECRGSMPQLVSRLAECRRPRMG